MEQEHQKQEADMRVRSSDWLVGLREISMDARIEADGAPRVAMLSGNSLLIETIVRLAEEECGHAMEWGFFGGRAVVRSHGDAKECRRALLCAMPQGDLTMADMVPTNAELSERRDNNKI